MATRMTFIVVLTGSILVGLGCTTTQINPGTATSATYRFGSLNATLNAPMDVGYQAAERAVQTLGLSVIQSLNDKLESRIIARDVQDKKITIALLSVTPDTTKLTINVGSQAKATRIYQTILDQLAQK
jgi:hypothetical protein